MKVSLEQVKPSSDPNLAPSLFDILNVRGGNVHLGGKLVVRLLDEFAPTVGSVFQFLETDGDILGKFDGIKLGSDEGFACSGETFI